MDLPGTQEYVEFFAKTMEGDVCTADESEGRSPRLGERKMHFLESLLIRTLPTPHLVISSLLIPVRPKCLAFPSPRPLTLFRLLFALDRNASGHGEGAGEACRPTFYRGESSLGRKDHCLGSRSQKKIGQE
ncbi:Hypothetical predicted protein [Olea europaea subsp. europaea]|uniref:Uncharacterized protein n=1 Tax=Olea europaea subsp. europaea TaxID=158383 RepID=A0A8S0SQY8_OLEEU|nr:Hypothetical predicted protein [Olea europaea subsp. europaea]